MPDGWFQIISQVDPLGQLAGIAVDVLPVQLADPPPAPDDPGALDAAAAADPLLSLKCRLYGDRPHDPCSGTTDDGTDRPCACQCHRLQ